MKDLKRRGLKGENLTMGVMDGLPGLESVFAEAFPKAKIQRCVVHELREHRGKTSPQSPKRLPWPRQTHLSCEEAKERFHAWKDTWEKIAPTAAACLEKDLQAVLQLYTQSKPLWKLLRSTNTIERAFKEFKRRTRQMDSLPNEDCCLGAFLQYHRI